MSDIAPAAPAGNGAVDWSDPCQRFRALQSAYFALLSGQREVEIRTRTLDAEDMVKFQQASLDDLRKEMHRAEDLCAQASGQPAPNARRAIKLGYRPKVG